VTVPPAGPPPDPAALAAALREVAASLPPGTALPVSREWLLALLEPLQGQPGRPQPPDRLLTAGEVAARLHCSKQHVYREAPRWPFTRKLAPRVLRFSEAGLERWLARQRAA